jgi:hypothetical protein
MAMAELRDWQQDDDRAAVQARLRVAEEQRVQAEGRCFAAERRRLDAERRLAEVQALLDEALAAGERTREIVVELIALAAQLRDSIDRAPVAAAGAGGARSDEAVAAERAQMADALAAAVERLRARVAEVKAGDADEPERQVPEPAARLLAEPPIQRPPHKHSMSAIGRWRHKRKQRKAR